MKYSPILFLSIGIVCLQCQSNNKALDTSDQKPDTAVSVATVPTFDTLAEQQALETVFKEFYRRLNTMCRTPDFEPEENAEGTAYIGINPTIHQKRLKELHATALLDSSFLKHYDKLAQRINRDLKSGKTTWNVGELPPFGNGAMPWINAQDHPDAYWNNIQINIQTLTPNKAVLTWTWGEDFHYPAEAIKTSEGWKISRLAGFDEANFFSMPLE
ncbi:MAG: hypothetical protein ACR2IL_06305 [Chitinophagaceae bacterium]